jgi:choline dehydrogenase-like flavoprotein
VGGGTVLYTGTAHKVPDFVLNDWEKRWKLEGFSRGEIENGYDEVASNMHISEHTEDDWNDNNRLFVEACRANNIRVDNLHRFVDRCIGCGFCYQGCKYNRKVTLLNTYIPKALNGGVQLISNFHVDEILYSSKHRRINGIKGIVRPTPPLAEPNSVSEGELEIEAKLVVLSAGAINTPSLLLRSKSVPDLSPALGRFILMQNAHNVNIMMPYKVSMIRGVPKAASTPEFRFIITPAQNHPIATANDITGFGLHWKHLMQNFHNLLQWQVICGDDPKFTNYVYLDTAHKTQIRYMYDVDYIYRQIQGLRTCAKLAFSIGADRVLVGPSKYGFVSAKDANNVDNLIHRRFFSTGAFPMLSAHPQGGCRMGANPKHSVVNFQGRPHKVQGLIVCDASLFPSPTHVNPVYTILAAATLIAIRTKEDINSLLG